MVGWLVLGNGVWAVGVRMGLGLQELGLQDAWQRHEVAGDWRATDKGRILEAERVRWRNGAGQNARLVGYVEWKDGLSWEHEGYLGERCVNRRRLWTKLRTGCLELRLETGRWERVSVAGAQVQVPRWARKCTLCYQEVEDAAHLMFRCPTYEKLRAEFWLRSGAEASVVRTARKVMEGEREQEERLWKWMMGGEGTERAMCFLERVMNERAGLLSW